MTLAEARRFAAEQLSTHIVAQAKQVKATHPFRSEQEDRTVRFYGAGKAEALLAINFIFDQEAGRHVFEAVISWTMTPSTLADAQEAANLYLNVIAITQAMETEFSSIQIPL